MKSTQFFMLKDQSEEPSKQAWQDFFLEQELSGVIVGTSRSSKGQYSEYLCRYFANQFGVRVVVIEDYPGNYQHYKDLYTDLLIVESDSRIEKSRLLYNHSQVDAIEKGAAIRYSVINKGDHDCQAALKDRKSVLWIGQPEYDDCIKTLSRVVDDLASLNVKLLFKAHPRDLGYKGNKYSNLVKDSGIEMIDVSQCSLDECAAFCPDAVITQFSSMAIEMGFYGIPSAYLLFSDVGGARLYDMCSYRYPELCSEGGALLIDETKGQRQKLDKLINGGNYRRKMMKSFDNYFQVNSIKVDHVIRTILNT